MSLEIFNKLSRSPRAPSGMVPNVWHFDIRFIQIQPPSHMPFIHTELVPMGPPQSLGFAFFPETAKAAASEIAKALIHAFVTGLGTGKYANAPAPYAPWAFTTDDRGLATAVGAELKRLGVAAPGLCDVKFVPALRKQADAAFNNMFESMKAAIGLEGIGRLAFTAPTSISFSASKPAPWVEQKSDLMEAALAYSQRLLSARPSLATAGDMGDLAKETQVTMEVLKQRDSATVRSRADAGDPQAALEYSLRLQFGIQCTPSRALAREYLVKVILNETASNAMKSIAHSLLIDWYVTAFGGRAMPSRYLHAAAHSADEAVRLASGASSPSVLFFAFYVLEKQAGQVVELYAQYKHVWKAADKRKAEVAAADSKATLKRMKQPNRYMCANVGCSVSSDSGHMLSQCSGKCDQDKKPSYCGRTVDWTNHKSFCTPGAPCSVIERPDAKVKGHSATTGGALEVPITNPDGTTTFVSTSTMSAEMLKEVKAYVEAAGGSPSGPGGLTLGGITLGLGMVNLGDADLETSEVD
ncbi:hypothetical protein B0H17DRAFT_1148281 [Mycena rosella]|uniref:MYND-type domain-containing protein n=1 Tax=Mycena rosella TaxID=1033263 RepID=A0AAD7CDP1_MYCRO|nr:hypothetical protein B0H17DRAFT_1148281 [Mycena rosella]